MGWSFVQRSPGGSQGSDVTAVSGSTSMAIGAYGSQPSLNNFIVVWVWCADSAASNTLAATDNAATPNSYTKLVGPAGIISGNVAILVAKVTSLPGSGNLNVTVSNTNSTILVATTAEFAGGTTSTDGSNSATGASGTPAPGSITTTVSNDLLLAVFEDPSATNPVTPTGYTNAGAENNSGLRIGQGVYQIASGTGSFNPTWNSYAAPWLAAQVALQPLIPVAGDDDPLTLAFRVNWLQRIKGWRQRATGLWTPESTPLLQGAL